MRMLWDMLCFWGISFHTIYEVNKFKNESSMVSSAIKSKLYICFVYKKNWLQSYTQKNIDMGVIFVIPLLDIRWDLFY